MMTRKTLNQAYNATEELLALMQAFRVMTNDCIRIGLENNASSLKRLSTLSYSYLKRHKTPSYYRLCAISKAAGILAARKKSIRRGIPTKHPYMTRPQLTSCYGFKITNGGNLRIPIGKQRFEQIKLNQHVLSVIRTPDIRVRSFTITPRSLALCISKEAAEFLPTDFVGVDSNLGNITVGNRESIIRYNLAQTVRIARRSKKKISAVTRNDVRVRTQISGKYGRRRRDRIQWLLHNVTKQIVDNAYKNKQALVLEDLTRLRKLYHRGNWQGRKYRGRMNSWSFAEAHRQIEYKATWLGVPVIKIDPYGTSRTCPQCGERLQEDKQLNRKLWCWKCRSIMDRDVVAAKNLAARGRVWFTRSRPQMAKDGAVEAMVSLCKPSVDAPELTNRQTPRS